MLVFLVKFDYNSYSCCYCNKEVIDIFCNFSLILSFKLNVYSNSLDMEILFLILLIYGLIGIFYLIFRSLPTLFKYILAIPIFIIATYKQSFTLIKNKQKILGYTLLLSSSLLYILLILFLIL